MCHLPNYSRVTKTNSGTRILYFYLKNELFLLGGSPTHMLLDISAYVRHKGLQIGTIHWWNVGEETCVNCSYPETLWLHALQRCLCMCQSLEKNEASFPNTAMNSSLDTVHTLQDGKTANVTAQRRPHTCRQRKTCRWHSRIRGGGAVWAWHTQSHVVCTVTGLAGAGSSRKLIGLSGANGMAGRGLRVTWAAGKAERKKQSVTHSHIPHVNTHLRR